jgi:hypothetical protein
MTNSSSSSLDPWCLLEACVFPISKISSDSLAGQQEQLVVPEIVKLTIYWAEVRSSGIAAKSLETELSCIGAMI